MEEEEEEEEEEAIEAIKIHEVIMQNPVVQKRREERTGESWPFVATALGKRVGHFSSRR